MTPKAKSVGFRQAGIKDAEFFCQLLNGKGWRRFINKNAASTLGEIREYIEKIVIPTYDDAGSGLWVVYRIEDNVSIGVCGLLKRKDLEAHDIAIALLEEHHGKGYAFDACTATLNYAFHELKKETILAIVTPDNDGCKKLLDRLNFKVSREYISDSGDNLEIYSLKSR